MAIEPGANVWMLVGGIVVENDVDDLTDRYLCLDGVQKTEFLMTMALHVATNHRAVEDVECGEQRRGAVPLVIVSHGSEPALLQRQTRLGAIEGLNLALLVDRQHDGVGRRIDIQPDNVAQLGDEVRIVRELELSAPMRLEPVRAFQMPRTALALMPLARAIRSAVQWVVSVGGSANVSATTRSAASGPSPGIREGRGVLSRKSPSTPSSMKRCCQRQTQVLEVPVRRMISVVPTPSALRSTSPLAKHASAWSYGPW